MAPKLILFILLLCSLTSYSQTTVDSITQATLDSIISRLNSDRWSNVIEEKLSRLGRKIISESEQTLRKLQKQEARLTRGLLSRDSVEVGKLLSEGRVKYQQLADQIDNKSSVHEGRLTGEYLSYFDSLKASLFFLSANTNPSAFESSQIKAAVNELKRFQSKLQQADAIKQFVRERKQYLDEIIGHYTSLPRNISKALKKYRKEIFYYSEQIRQYREMFRDPDKVLSKALTLLSKLPAFQQFMRTHSELGSLFSLPSIYYSAPAITGLQTRLQVQQVMTTQIGSGTANGAQIFGQQIQSAQSQLEKFKQKINTLGGSSGDIDMPDFKPNTQHRKTFFERLEYGANIQTTKSNFIFPSTTDLAFTLGYRIDDKKIAGVGVAGKIGWGKDIRHVSVTGQGMSLRTFFDIKIKNSFYASGGLEYNYQQPFAEIQQLHNLDMWSRSGLVGITKIISIKSKVFKKTKVQLLWDFLSYQQLPGAEPIKFRVGYNF